MPAQSPTLSPTLSAMVAGLRGSSSGMPASTLPTRSAPTSAALVKMPPPTRRNRASSEPPKPKPIEDRRARVLEDHDDERGAEQAEADGEHAGDAAGAEGDRRAPSGMRAGLGGGGGAHVAPGGQRHADEAGEAGHDAAERGRPACGTCPDWPKLSASLPSGLLDRRRGEEHDDRERDEDHADRAELPLQVGRARPPGSPWRSPASSACPGPAASTSLREEEADADGHEGSDRRETTRTAHSPPSR